MPARHSEPPCSFEGQHDLEVIEAVADTIPGDLRVVRWCKVCGVANGMKRALE